MSEEEQGDRERLARIILFGREYKQSPKEMADAILEAGWRSIDSQCKLAGDHEDIGRLEERERIRREVEKWHTKYQAYIGGHAYEELLAIIDNAKEEEDNE